MPPVRILDNMQLEPNDYIIKIKEVEAGTGQHLPQPAHGDGPDGRADQPARPAHHRADLRPARDLDRRRPRDEAELKGYTVVDPATVISTHLTEVLKANMADLLSYANVQ